MSHNIFSGEEVISRDDLVAHADARNRKLEETLEQILAEKPFVEITEDLNDLHKHRLYAGLWTLYKDPELDPIRAQIINDVDKGKLLSRDAYKSMRFGLDEKHSDYSLDALKAQPRHSIPWLHMGMTFGYITERARVAVPLAQNVPGWWFLGPDASLAQRRDEFEEFYRVGWGIRGRLLGCEIEPHIVSQQAVASAFARFEVQEREYSLSRAVPKIAASHTGHLTRRYASG